MLLIFHIFENRDLDKLSCSITVDALKLDSVPRLTDHTPLPALKKNSNWPSPSGYFANCVTWDKSLHLSEPQFSYL